MFTLSEKKEPAMRLSGSRVFQAEETASAKAGGRNKHEVLEKQLEA